MKIHLIIIILSSSIVLAGCPAVRETVKGVMESPLNASEKENLREVEAQMLQGDTVEMEIDKKVSLAVKQMVATLKPAYKTHWLGKYRLGFLEISGIDRKTVSRMHQYLTEKTLIFSFLQPDIADNFNIVERFLIKNIQEALYPDEHPDSSEIMEQKAARDIGRRRGIDVIETGVVTESNDFLDINLRMVETKRGQIIAVGSVKIEKTQAVRKWLEEMDSEW